MAIIGISGKIGSGKDTAGKIIQYLTTTEMGVSTLSKTKNTSLTFDEFSDNFRNPKTIGSDWKVKKFAYKLKQIAAILTGCTVEDLESQEFKDKELPKEWWTYRNHVSTTNFQLINRSIDELIPYELQSSLELNRVRKPTYRLLLQLIGTECMRDIIGTNTWVNALFSEYKGTNVLSGLHPDEVINPADCYKLEYPNWIITDCRFPNEAKAIEDRGGILIRVDRKYHTDKLGDHTITTIPMKNGIMEPSTHPSETALDNHPFSYIINNNGTIEDLIESVRKILVNEKIIK